MYDNEIADKRSGYDDLIGFIYDLEVHLDETDTYDSLDISIEQRKPMILVKAILKTGFDIDVAIESTKHVWMNKIRYVDFEKHSVKEVMGGVDFWFCTKSYNSSLGVNGCIQIRKNDY